MATTTLTIRPTGRTRSAHEQGALDGYLGLDPVICDEHGNDLDPDYLDAYFDGHDLGRHQRTQDDADYDRIQIASGNPR